MCTGLAVAAVLLSLDQWSKAVAVAELVPGERVDVLGDVLGLRLFFNTGAAFSLGTSITPVLTVVQSVAVVVMVVALVRSRSAWWTVALGILLGGASGNLVDRLTREPGFGRGAVVDFLELPRWPIFNVADMAIVGAAVLIVVLSVRGVDYRPVPVAA